MNLGTFEDSGEAVALDLEALIGTHLCIQANSGGGKSGTIRRLLEITHGKLQHIVLDVEDEFYTLREKFEYMIAGGDNGDCAATVNNADKLALMILRTGFSAIVQINGLSMDDRREFIGRFLSALIAAPKDLWRPALVILDEAQSYAPQVGKVESSDGVLQLMTLGRKRGFTGVLATPRAASIHKDATGPVNNWLMGRVGQPADRRAVADALGFSANSPEARGLQKMVRREFWAFGPALCSEPRKMKVGEIETTAVKAGQAAPPTPPAPAAMKRILAELNAAAAVADEATSEIPPSGRSEKGSAAPDKQALAEEYRRGFGEGEITGRGAGFDEGAAMVRGAAKEAFTAARDLLGQVSAVIDDQLLLIDMTALADLPPPPKPTDLPKPKPLPQPTPRPQADGEFSGPERAVLNSLATWKRWGYEQPTNAQVAFIAGYSATSTSYTKARGSLKSAGMVSYPEDGRVSLTREGAAKACPLDIRDIPAHIAPRLSGPERLVFEAAVKAYPRELSNDQAAVASNYSVTSTSYTKARGSIRSKELIDYPRADHLRASDWLFVTGRRSR